MKTDVLPTGEFDEFSTRELNDQHKLATVDWKESPMDVLAAVDELLVRYGLTVVTIDYGVSDDYHFAILPRSKE